MSEYNPELARFNLRLLIISLIAAFLSATVIGFVLNGIGISGRIVTPIMLTVLFAPLAIVSGHGFKRGYCRTNTRTHVVRGSLAVFGNVAILLLYAAILIVAWFRRW